MAVAAVVVADTVVVGMVEAVAANVRVRAVAVGTTWELAADEADRRQNIAGWAGHHRNTNVEELAIAAAIMAAG